jgi:hypothetical protein
MFAKNQKTALSKEEIIHLYMKILGVIAAQQCAEADLAFGLMSSLVCSSVEK